MTKDIRPFIEQTVNAHVANGAKVISIESHVLATRVPPESDITAHDVRYRTKDGQIGTVRLVIKEAPLAERRIQVWLNEQNLPVPFGHSLDLTTDKPAPLCLQLVPDTKGRVEEVARSLARIHAAALGKASDLAFLPRADAAFFSDFIVDRCWRQYWDSTRENTDFVDYMGRRTPPGPPGDFQGRWERYTQSIEEAAERFVQAMRNLWHEGDSLTLVHGDFHGGNVRFDQGRASIIDWGHACYGPLYVDLPNHFSRDDALLYRDALAEFGHDIPKDEFLARYDAARPYPGFKYFGLGLLNWRFASPPYQDKHVHIFMDMILWDSLPNSTK